MYVVAHFVLCSVWEVTEHYDNDNDTDIDNDDNVIGKVFDLKTNHRQTLNIKRDENVRWFDCQ